MTGNREVLATLAQRRREGDWTEEEVLLLARKQDFIVHKYRTSHEKLRKLTRRMRRDGKLLLVLHDGRQLYYRTPT